MKQKVRCKNEKPNIVLFDHKNVRKLRRIRKKVLDDILDHSWLPKERMPDFLAYEFFKKVNSTIHCDVVREFFFLFEAIEDQRDEYSAADLSEVLGVSKTYIQIMLRNVGLEALHSNDVMRQAIEWGIETGANLRDIEKRAPCTYQNISLYFNHRPELKKRWNKSKKQKKEQSRNLAKQRTGALQKILALVRYNAELRAQSDFALAKATLYTQKIRRTYYKFPMLVEFFDRYKNEKGITLKILGQPYGIQPIKALKILRKVGLKSPRKTYNKLSTKQIKAVKTGRTYGLSLDDVSYFLGVKSSTAYNKYHQCIKSSPPKRSIYATYGINLRSRYRCISKVLEALEAGFDNDEICEYADVTPTVIEKVNYYKEELTDKIVKGLRKLYNNPDITKPYPSEQCVFPNQSTSK